PTASRCRVGWWGCCGGTECGPVGSARGDPGPLATPIAHTLDPDAIAVEPDGIAAVAPRVEGIDHGLGAAFATRGRRRHDEIGARAVLDERGGVALQCHRAATRFIEATFPVAGQCTVGGGASLRPEGATPDGAAPCPGVLGITRVLAAGH